MAKPVDLRTLRQMLKAAEALDPRSKDARQLRARITRRECDDAMRSLGLVKVRGAVSGRIYWE